MKIRTQEILFLYDNDEFTHRRIEIAFCPKCEKKLIRITERRILDDVVFDQQYQKGKAEKKLQELANEVQYSSLDTRRFKQAPSGWKYGENKEVYNKKTGETKIIQKSVDFYGNKEIADIKILKHNNTKQD